MPPWGVNFSGLSGSGIFENLSCVSYKKREFALQQTLVSAGRAGFEPAVEFNPDTHLAGEPNQPLWHLPRLPDAQSGKAEGEGFEPTMDCSIPVFKTGALNHSAIPPSEMILP